MHPNDSYSGITQGIGYTGFSRSTDGGATWSDRGAIPQGGGGQSGGDPSVVWRKTDGAFYITTLHDSGLGLWKSTDDCNSFTWVGLVHSGTGDDKEFMAVDNNLASPFYGRLYVAWTNFNVGGGTIQGTYSTNGGITWSSPVNLNTSGDDVQSA